MTTIYLNHCHSCGKELTDEEKIYPEEHDCVTFLRAELERVKAENEWVRYVDGDTSTYPKDDGLIYQVIYGANGNEWESHEIYNFTDGWATDKNVLWYRPVPNTPAAPEEGE